MSQTVGGQKKLRRYWEENYEKFLNQPVPDPDWKVKAIGYQPWPALFNREMDFFERYTARCLFDRFLPSLDGKTALDIGCGTGRWVRLLTGYGAKVTGVDLVRDLLAENKKELPRIPFSAMAAYELGFKNETFDLVSAPIVLQHIPPVEKKQALDEIRRVLKRGGLFFLLETLPGTGEGDGQTSWLLCEEEWRRSLEIRGFEILEIRPLHGYP